MNGSIMILRIACVFLFCICFYLLIKTIQNYITIAELVFKITGVLTLTFLTLIFLPVSYNTKEISNIEVRRLGKEYTVIYHGETFQNVKTEFCDDEEDAYYLEYKETKNIFGSSNVYAGNEQLKSIILKIPKKEEVLQTTEK